MAEVLRRLAFRNVKLEMMESALRGVATLSTITKVGHLEVASFVADVYSVEEPGRSASLDRLLDLVYVTMRDSRASPEEFVRAFEDSKRLVLSGHQGLSDLLSGIQNALGRGVPPDEVYDHLANR